MKYIFFPSFLSGGMGEFSAAQKLELLKQFEAFSDEEALDRVRKLGPGKLFKEISWVEILDRGLQEK